MKDTYKIFWLFIFCFSICRIDAQNRNVLFIAVDDLKPLLGVYGDEMAITPNIDRLAKMGVTFTNAHCQQAVCAPSRASLMTGLRPDITEVFDLKTQMRDKNPNILTLPEHFKKNGYTTVGMGKIFDRRSVDNGLDKQSWSKPHMETRPNDPVYGKAQLGRYQSKENDAIFEKIIAEAKAAGKKPTQKYLQSKHKPATESMDIPDEGYYDGALAVEAIRQLKLLAKKKNPFLLCVGFHKPHLPFVAPKKYWDLYQREKMPLSAYQKWAKNTIKLSYHNIGEIKSYTDIPASFDKNGIINEAKQRELIHGYYACVSYIDAQVGKILDALEEQGLTENTSIVLWGDHGWHLGDHGLWNKHSNFEQATRSPLIFVDPDLKKDKLNPSPVEFVDIFPTLCDLTGIEQPEFLQGKSLKPILSGNKKKVKEFAMSQYPRGNVMGYAMRTERYRYVAWYRESRGKFPEANKLIYKELYDYKKDPLETKNIIEENKKLAEKFQGQLNGFINELFKQKKAFKKTQPKVKNKKPKVDNNVSKSTNNKALGENLIANGGFENGQKPWRFGKQGKVAIIEGNAKTGKKSLQFTGTKCNAFQNLKNLKPNTTYQVTVFAKTENRETVLLKIREYGNEDLSVRINDKYYKKYTIKFKTGASNTSARIALVKYKKNATSKSWFDDVMVQEVGKKTTKTNAAHSGENLIVNAGFEKGRKPWSFGKQGAIEIVKNNARTGAAALQFTGTKCSAFQNLKNLEPRTTYEVRAFIKTENNEPVLLKVRNYGGEDITVRYNQASYGEVKATFTTGENNTSARIAFVKYKSGASGKSWFDDVSVQKVINKSGNSLQPSIKDILKEKYNNGQIYVGATIAYKQLKTFAQDILTSQFNYTVPENAGKQTRVHPTPNKWNWTEIDAVVQMAKENDIVVRLHGPISPQASHWAKNDKRTAKELEKNMTEYMTKQCKRFNEHTNVKWMDVVNETVTPKGEWFGPKKGVEKWENPWTIIGTDTDKNKTPIYISKAFEIANEHAPDIKLVLNQHGGMEAPMWEKVKETISYLKAKGLRVDGVGWQAHLGTHKSFGAAELKYLSDLVDWAHANDLEFHVTEIDYKIKEALTDDVLQQQAKAYASVLKVLIAKTETGVVTYNTWGIVDRKGKHTNQYRFLFDKKGEPKPAFFEVKRILSDGI